MSTTRSPPEYHEKYARTSSSGPGPPSFGSPLWYLDRAAAESFLTREEQHGALPAPSVSDSIPFGLARGLLGGFCSVGSSRALRFAGRLGSLGRSRLFALRALRPGAV